jgi:L-2-hydroxyglutarate oxidase LhgO
MSERFDAVIVGAGVVGLAVARELARQGREVLVLERHRKPGEEASSRNSGVIHSGIYYPTGSLKARMCLRGRELLYAYCAEHNLAHRQCGKLIVCQDRQRPALEALLARARANGVDDLMALEAREARELEPTVQCAAALYSPSTGVVDVHELLLALVGDLEGHGGAIAFGTSVEEVELDGAEFVARAVSGGELVPVRCASLINAAGLEAVNLVRRMRGYPGQRLRTAFYAKGCYFSLRGARPFRHLVYPMPDDAGLGIHATLDLDGSTRFGPNVVWVDRPEYSVDERHAAEFYESIRTYWPELKDGALQPAFAGIRPKLVGPGAPAADFLIEGHEEHGCAGLVNLLGIESPGLTGALAIGEYVAGLV